MSDMPQSPRERLLREADLEQQEGQDYDPASADDPVVARMVDAAEAAQQARMASAEQEFIELTEPEQVEEQEVLTATEVEAQLTRLDQLLNADIPEIQRQIEADDALQGITVLLGMGFGADVQTMTLAALSRYRKIKNY